MKYIALFLTLLVLIACEEKEKPETPLAREKRQLKTAVRQIEGTSEKIVFISAIMNLSYDTVYSVLLDYTLKTEGFDSDDDSVRVNANLAIEYISSKYHISKKKVSRVLFAYKYEMITKEEIGQDAIDNAEAEAAAQRSDEKDY